MVLINIEFKIIKGGNNMFETFKDGSFFIIFIPLTYICYNLLKAFDYEKILRRGQIGQLKALMFIVSVGIAFLFASAFVEVFDRLSKFFV